MSMFDYDARPVTPGVILEVELSSAGQRDWALAVLAGVGCGKPEPDERPDRLARLVPGDACHAVERGDPHRVPSVAGS
jgi:hypothetical protein